MLVKKPFFPLFFSLINNFEVFKQVFWKNILVRMLVVQAKAKFDSGAYKWELSEIEIHAC